MDRCIGLPIVGVVARNKDYELGGLRRVTTAHNGEHEAQKNNNKNTFSNVVVLFPFSPSPLSRSSGAVARRCFVGVGPIYEESFFALGRSSTAGRKARAGLARIAFSFRGGRVRSGLFPAVAVAVDCMSLAVTGFHYLPSALRRFYGR